MSFDQLTLCQQNLEKVIRKFVPKEMIPSDWKCNKQGRLENIQSLFTGGDQQFGMFPSAEHLGCNINTYLSFPNHFEYFNFHRSHGINGTPTCNSSLKDRKYIYKNELFLLFEDCDNYFEGWMLGVVDSILNDCWEVLGVGSHHELIACPDVIAIHDEINKDWNFAVQHIHCCKNYDLDKTIWRDATHETINSMSDVILESIEKFLEHYPPKKYSKELGAIIIWLGLVMENVANFAKQKSIHLPPLYSTTPTNETKSVIRAFSVGNNLFVMAHELLKTLKDHNKDVSGFEEEVLRMPRLSTLSYREVLQKVDRNVLKNLEFVKMKQIMVMFAQTPIPTHDGAYCIFASDALYELLVDMIVAKKVFHTIGEDSWTHIKKFFKSIKSYFDESRGVYFIDLKDVEIIKNKWEKLNNTHLKKFSFKLTDTSKMPTLSIENLKKTLKLLNLDKSFRDISKYAERCFQSQMRDDPTSTNMHIAITRCQLNAIARKLPSLLKFIHAQGSCTRMSITGCELCNGGVLDEVPEESDESEEERVVQEEENTEKKKKTSKKAKKPVSSNDFQPALKEICELFNGDEVAKESGDSKEELKEEKTEKKKKTSKKAKKPEDLQPAPKESKSCSKCLRASEFTIKANSKLKLSNIENKQLKKELATAQLEIEVVKQKGLDKNEKIRMLEKLLEEKENVIKEQAAKQEERIKGLEKLLEEKDDVIKQQKEKLEEQAVRIGNLQIDQQETPNEKAEKIQDALAKLLAINGVLHSKQPISKCTEITNRVIINTSKEKNRRVAKTEQRRFCEERLFGSCGRSDRHDPMQSIRNFRRNPKASRFSSILLRIFEGL